MTMHDHPMSAAPAQAIDKPTGSGELASPRCSVFDDEMMVYAEASRLRLPITSVAGLARQFRRALIAVANSPVAEILSGHLADGSPSQTDHLAIVPLPDVTGRHADGTLLGIALALPRAARIEARHAVLRALDRLERPARTSRDGDARGITLLLGDTGELVLNKLAWGHRAGATLRPWTWTRPSTRWASVTPVALDRNPGDLYAGDPGARGAALEAASRSIADAVRRIGLPAPLAIDVVQSRVLPGIAAPFAYPRFAQGVRKLARVLVHVRLRFAERVRGPLLVGAGRYQGLGLCVPVDRVDRSGPDRAALRRATP